MGDDEVFKLRYRRRLRELPPQQRRFVEEYLKDFDGPAAAMRAGYSQKTARHQSSRLLTRCGAVKRAIDAGLMPQEMWARDLANRLRRHLEAIGFSGFGDLFDERGNPLPMDAWPAGAEHAVQSITIKRAPQGGTPSVMRVTIANKVRALSRLLDMASETERKGEHKALTNAEKNFADCLAVESMLGRGWRFTTPDGENLDRDMLQEDFDELKPLVSEDLMSLVGVWNKIR